jgi:acylphosphatase
MSAENFSLHVVVEGRVQGVGFRYFVLNRAQQYDLVGWVRNTRDGDVEIQAEGPRAILERLLEDVRRGPQAAVVTQASVEWDSATGAYRTFEVLPTR